MSKMSDDFKNKSALRNRATKMADGGLAGLRQRTIDGSVDPKPAAPTPVAAAPEPTEQEKAKSVGISIPKYVPPAPTPAPSMFSRLRKAVGLADGGSPWDSAYKPGGSLGVRATPAPIPTILARPPVQTAVAAPTPEPSPAATPSPALAPASPAATPAAAPAPTQPTAAGSGIGREMNNSQWNQMVSGTLPTTPTVSSAANWNSQQNGTGMKMGLRGGGRVTGPGGPREDKVGPVMLSNGEYVLPAKTVQKLGGPEEVDELVRATNDGREPHGAEERGEQHGLRGLAAGGYPDIDPRMLPDRAASMPMVEVPPAGPTPDVPQPARGPTNWDNVNRVYGNRPTNPVSSEMQAFQRSQAADQAGFKAGQAVQAAKQAAAASAPAVEAAAPKAASPGFFKAASSLVGSAARGAGSALRFAAKVANNPYAVGAGAAVASDDVGTGSDILRSTNGSVSNAYQGYQLTPTAAAMSDRERYALMQRVNSGDMMAKQVLLGASPVSVTVDPTAKYGGSQGNMTAPASAPGQPAVGLHGQDPNVTAALAQNEMNAKAMNANTPNTGGSILRTGNTFYGGNPDPNLTAQAAAEGRQRYQNDAAGMYAAIQGHIANGDLETANKLAWDPQSRALVNQGYAARNAAMAAASRSANPDEDALNSRFDKNADRLRGLFRSDKAQGNLAKHLAENERARSGELANLRNTKVTQRGQDILSETNQARIASEQAIANQRNAMDWRRTMLEQTNKDREFGLNQQRHGTEVAKILYDQSVEREKRNQDHIDKFAAKQFVGPDGKVDQGMAARFNEFVSSGYGDLGKIPDAERNSVLAKALTEFRMNERSRASGSSFTGKSSAQYSPTGAPRRAELGDLAHGLGPTDYIRSKMAQVGVGNPDVVPDANGQVRRVTDLADGNTDQDALNRIYGLRNK